MSGFGLMLEYAAMRAKARTAGGVLATNLRRKQRNGVTIASMTADAKHEANPASTTAAGCACGPTQGAAQSALDDRAAESVGYFQAAIIAMNMYVMAAAGHAIADMLHETKNQPQK